MNFEFTALLPTALRETVDLESATVFGCWPDGRIAYVNSAYGRFALENGGGPTFLTKWGVGCSVFDIIAPPLGSFFRKRFEEALDGNVTSYAYECSSPTTKREFHATFYPVGKRQGVLQVHTLRLEAPMASAPLADFEAIVRNPRTGLVVMCMHCRRTRRVDDGSSWVFVPAFVAKMPEPVSHGLCEPCSAHFYP